MSEDDRGNNGRFAKGSSGNPAGARGRTRKPLLTRADMERTIVEVASMPTLVSIGGKPTKMTTFKRSVHSLASGKPANRLAANDFIEVAMKAASDIEHRERYPPKPRPPQL